MAPDDLQHRLTTRKPPVVRGAVLAAVDHRGSGNPMSATYVANPRFKDPQQ